MTNVLRKVGMAAMVWVSSVLGLYIAYPLIDNILSSMPDVDPMLVGLAWISFIVIGALGVLVIPAALILSND